METIKLTCVDNKTVCNTPLECIRLDMCIKCNKHWAGYEEKVNVIALIPFANSEDSIGE